MDNNKKCSNCKSQRWYPKDFTRKNKEYKTCNKCSQRTKTGTSRSVYDILDKYFDIMETDDTTMLALKHRFQNIQQEQMSIYNDLLTYVSKANSYGSTLD